MADAVIYTWVFNGTGGSVLLVALTHAAGNTWGGHVHGHTFAFAPPGALAFAYLRVGVYVVVAIAIVLRTRGRLGLPGRQEP